MSIACITKYAALAALASAALMQGAEHDRFHLPVSAHFGSVVLQPGDYRLAPPDSALGDPAFLVEGAGKTIRKIPLVTNLGERSQTNWLKLQEIDGTYFVREFFSGRTGKSFVFSVPKSNHRPQLVGVINTIPTDN